MLPVEFRSSGDAVFDWNLAAASYAGVNLDKEVNVLLNEWNKSVGSGDHQRQRSVVMELDGFLTATAYTLGAVRECHGDDFANIYGKVVHTIFSDDGGNYEYWMARSLGGQHVDQRNNFGMTESLSGLRRLVGHDFDINLSVAGVLLRSMASYAMWRAVEIAGYIPDGEKPRRHVAAIGLDVWGHELATAYRGEDTGEGVNHSKHAEHVLIEKLERSGRLEEVFLVGVNLTPCRERSMKHAGALCGDLRGCAQRLIDVGVSVVALTTPDNGESGRGAGKQALIDGDVVVFEADHPMAIASGMLANAHFKDMQQGLRTFIGSD